jgi:hypothetical protein
VELGHFGLMVDFFLLALAKKVGSVLGQILFPSGDLGRMNPYSVASSARVFDSDRAAKGYGSLKFCAVTCMMRWV